MRPLRPCNQVGCANLVQPPERYCGSHRQSIEQRRRDQQRDYDRHRRDRRAKAFYNSREWAIVRKAVLVRDNYLCVMCRDEQRITPAEHVHHTKELRTHWELRLDPNNLISLCPSCHGRQHTRR